MSSPTARSLEECRRRGWPAGVVEKWISLPGHPGGGVRKDLFGAIDVIALDGQPGSLGIQATSGSNASARLEKAAAIPEIGAWLDAGNRFQVWAWRKAGPRGKRKTWQVRVVDLTARDEGEDA